MLTNIFVSLVGILIFLFVFWRRLKEDYTGNEIFTTAFLIVIGISLGAASSQFFFPIFWFWAGLLGAIAGFGAGIFSFKMRFFESFEAAGVALLPWLGILFLVDSTQNSSLFSLMYSLGVLALLLLFYYLDENYKDFAWYKSGRIGFAGVSTLGAFFLLRAAISLFEPGVLSFAGRFDALLSGVVAFILFLMLFNLARSGL